jgi:hypothetical protein
MNRIIDGHTTSTLQEIIDPCEDEFESSGQRHGKLVSCIAWNTRQLKEEGVITGRERARLIKTAARAKMQRVIKKWKERKKRLRHSRGGHSFWWVCRDR